MTINGSSGQKEKKLVLVGGVSRSGTTLVCAVLDASPYISAGTELVLIPEENKSFRDKTRALENLDDRTKKVSQRSGYVDADWANAFSQLRSGGSQKRDPVLNLNLALLIERSQREETSVLACKWNRGGAKKIIEHYDQTAFIVVVRHPSDVVSSQIKQGFERTPQQILNGWRDVYKGYLEMKKKFPTRVSFLRYEDLVSKPALALGSAFAELGLPFHADMLQHQNSNSKILAGSHVNKKTINQPISGSVSKTVRQDLKGLDLKISKDTDEVMNQLGYTSRDVRDIQLAGPRGKRASAIDTESMRSRREGFEKKRKYTREQYSELLNKLSEDSEVMTLKTYTSQGHPGEKNVLLIRHDIDHDIENAVKIAKWEASEGIKSTYCVLHTAWYYGEYKHGQYIHSRLLEESALEIQSLGHEINLHNNLVTLRLLEGAEPNSTLASELSYFREIGVQIDGTSTHGDKLCRSLSYRNFELFSESIGTRFGGPRTVENPETGHSLELGLSSYRDFGLSYEAYDVTRDLYVTDSGGNLRERLNAEGRREFGRSDGMGKVTGLLTHPIWWKNFD